jgi:hypothetical protein
LAKQHGIDLGRWFGETDGYIGYVKPYATSHGDFDDDKPLQEEMLNGRARGAAIELARSRTARRRDVGPATDDDIFLARYEPRVGGFLAVA